MLQPLPLAQFPDIFNAVNHLINEQVATELERFEAHQTMYEAWLAVPAFLRLHWADREASMAKIRDESLDALCVAKAKHWRQVHYRRRGHVVMFLVQEA